MAPAIVPSDIKCIVIKDYLIPIHNWTANTIKSKCFNYCEIHLAYQIDGNLVANVRIIPRFHDNNATRDFADEHSLWAEVVTALKSEIPTKELDINRHLLLSDSHEVTNMYSFWPILEHCNGDDSTKLHNHLKQVERKIRGSGINPDSNQDVVVLVSSFSSKIGDQASNNNSEIYEVRRMDELIKYVRVGFSIEDIKEIVYIPFSD